jgi:A/G-specific adenine glycosylase
MLRAAGKLGYPRQAKRLHECATVIARDHGDVVPDDVDTLLTRTHALGGGAGRGRAAASPSRVTCVI